MEIIYHPLFEKRLIDILDYIALDKISAIAHLHRKPFYWKRRDDGGEKG